MAAEVSGTLGPDTNTQSGLSGNTQISGTAYLDNGAACTFDWECYSGHCAHDFDGNGAWCAPLTSCAHDSIIYAEGDSTCYGTQIKETCTNGSWVVQVCPGSCSNGECIAEEETPTPSPPTGAPSAGVGGGAPGAAPSPTPTETTPTETLEIIKETVAESTYSYRPSPEELRETMREAGLSEEVIERALKQIKDIEITRELVVERQTNTATGETTYRSTFTIRIFNSSNKRFEGITIVEYIPKEIAASASEIRSLAEFEVLREDPIIAWNIDRLEPQQVVVIEYWVNREVSERLFGAGKTVFQAAREEVIIARASLTVYVVSEGAAIEEPIEVRLFDELGNLVSKKHTEKGRVEFTDLEAGYYSIKVSESANYYGLSQEVVLEEGEEKIVRLELERKLPAITSPATPVEKPVARPKVDYTVLLVLIILGCVAYVLYFYGKKKKPTKRPKKRKKKRRERKREEKKEHEEVRRPFAGRRESKFRIE